MKALYTTIAAVFGIGMAAATAAGICIDSGIWLMIYYIVFCLIFFPLTSYLHELGHVIFGSACGMNVSIIKTRFFSSSACSVRPKRGGKMKKRFIITALGGLIINLILIIWGIVVLCIPAISNVWSFTAPASVYFLLLNSFPVEYSSGKTDMLVVMEAAKNEPTAQVLLAVLEIQGEMAAGKNLADIEEDRLLNLPQLPDDDYNFAMLTSLRREYYLAKGDKKTSDKYYMRLRDLGYDDKDFKS